MSSGISGGGSLGGSRRTCALPSSLYEVRASTCCGVLEGRRAVNARMMGERQQRNISNILHSACAVCADSTRREIGRFIPTKEHTHAEMIGRPSDPSPCPFLVSQDDASAERSLPEGMMFPKIYQDVVLDFAVGDATRQTWILGRALFFFGILEKFRRRCIDQSANCVPPMFTAVRSSCSPFVKRYSIRT